MALQLNGPLPRDKIMQFSEVTLETTSTHNFTNEDKLDSLLNPVGELEMHIPPDEVINISSDQGVNVHAYSSHAQNGVFPSGPKAPENLQEVTHVGHDTDHYQSQ